MIGLPKRAWVHKLFDIRDRRLTRRILSLLIAGATACSGPIWGPSGTLRVEWTGRTCAVRFSSRSHAEQFAVGVTRIQEGGFLECARAGEGYVTAILTPRAGHLSPDSGGYHVNSWNDEMRHPPPRTAIIAATSFSNRLAQLQSEVGSVMVNRWPSDSRKVSEVKVTGEVHVRSGFRPP